KNRIIELIEREMALSSEDRPGEIMAKMNSLEDPEIISALLMASRAGIRIQLNIRGICCLRPGLKGISENIEVVSVIDRFLEHARILYFRNGGNDDLYLSSADWMTRNLDRRVELLFPVKDPVNRQRLVRFMKSFFSDTVKGWRMKSDGTWSRSRGARGARAQELIYRTGAFREG
ncbi:polyphosphate kinase 1, partial [Candidatus Fermentibacteria bacterium]|nr:polyphosphate kinase 1 [Candidatus Fermentibacteria bacterium]